MRKSSIGYSSIVKMVLLMAAWFSFLFYNEGNVPAFAEGTRSFELSYEVRLDPLPQKAKELRLWIPLATSDSYQTIRRRVIQFSKTGFDKTFKAYEITRDPEYGNDILFLTLRKPLPKHLNLLVQYEAVVHEKRLPFDVIPTVSYSLDGRERALHLKSNRLMVVNDDIHQLAKGVTQRFRDPAEKAKAIYRYVIERMTYEKQTPGWGRGDTLRACEVGAGNCTDFHSLFISMARAVGIPARFRIGTPVPKEPQGDIPGYHCWAEVYLPQVGWVPVDASEAWRDRSKLDYFFGTYDANRLSITTGRDIQLVPKPANGPINIFIYPYAEVDGKTFDQIQTRFRFRDLAMISSPQGDALKGEESDA